MMRLPWRRPSEPDKPPTDPRLAEAEQQVERLERRAEDVNAYLRPRHQRNHWLETVEQTFRKAT